MFTQEQLVTAHSKVKSGADFPAYVKEIKALGVTHYETYVSDGRINYHGENEYMVTIPAKFSAQSIADQVEVDYFKAELLAHQQGKTDFLTFIKMCAEAGVEKWEIDTTKMTCTYFDTKHHALLVEVIPH